MCKLYSLNLSLKYIDWFTDWLNQTWKNDKKHSFGHDFGLFGLN